MPWPGSRVPQKPCELCGGTMHCGSPARKYCDACGARVAREQHSERDRMVRLPALREQTRRKRQDPDYGRKINCARCGRTVVATSGTQKWCADCRKIVGRQQAAAWRRKAARTPERWEALLDAQARRRKGKRAARDPAREAELELFRKLYPDRRERWNALRRRRRDTDSHRQAARTYQAARLRRLKEMDQPAYRKLRARLAAKRRTPGYRAAQRVRMRERYQTDADYRNKVKSRARRYNNARFAADTFGSALAMAGAVMAT